MNKTKLGIIYALIAASGMGTMAIFAKFAYSYGATPLTMLTIRFGLGSLILWLYLHHKQEIVRLAKNQVFALIGLGTIYGLMSFLFFTALKFISAGMASLLLYTAPILVLIIGVLIGDEKLTFHKVTALVLASTGLYLVLDLSVQFNNLFGISIGLATGICYAFFIVGSNRFTSNINPLLATAYVTGTTFVLQFFVSLIFNQLNFLVPWPVWLYGAAIAVFATALAITSLYKSIHLIGPGRASIVSTAEPVVTIVLAAIFFDESLRGWQFVGGALIIAAIITLQLSEINKEEEKVIPNPTGTGEEIDDMNPKSQ